MTMEECYARMGADYTDVLRRLGKEERIRRFLARLPEDESFPNLCRALEEQNVEEAFRAAHSLKGICMNLGLGALCRSATALTEELRNGELVEISAPLVQQLEKDYRETIRAIAELLDEG